MACAARTIPAILVVYVVLCTGAAAQDSAWIGKSFMPKMGTKARVENREVPMSQLSLPYVVRKVNGDWLWVGRAWVKKEDVLPLDQAAAYFTEYLRNNPGSSSAYNNRGIVRETKNELDSALDDYTEAIRLDPQNAMAYRNRGIAWKAKMEFDNALNDDTEAIRLDPQDAMAYNSRGNAWKAKKEFDNALKDYTDAIRLDSRYAAAYYNRGNAWKAKNELDNAIKDYTEAIRLDPQDTLAYSARGNAWKLKKQFDKALTDYAEAIRIDPRDWHAYNSRAWLRATADDAQFRDGSQAVADALKACDLSQGKGGFQHGTLAAAYAERGEFELAVKWQNKAIEFMTEENLDPAELQRARERLALYESRQPHREVQH